MATTASWRAPFHTARSVLSPQSLNYATCREHGEKPFEQSIESFMQELDLISTRQACVSDKSPVDKPTQIRM